MIDEFTMYSSTSTRCNFLLGFVALGLLPTACCATSGDLGTFTNPVIAADWPDPAIYRENGVCYSVATGLKTIRRSTNLIDWIDTGIKPVSPAAYAKLSSISEKIWAPCVVKLNGRWVLYISLFISDLDCRVEALVSDSPTGPFEYAGEVVNGPKIGILNTIDPFVLKVDGRVWMFVGSCADGIHRVELAADGLSAKSGATYTHVAGRRNPGRNIWGEPGTWEGSYLLNRNGWWYLFFSGGIYRDHTYHLMVGRSRTIDGVFLNHEGRPLTEGVARTVLRSDKGDKFYGPGHNGEVFTSADGRDFMFYHCHDTAFPPASRPVLLQELKWTPDAWPYFENSRPKLSENRFRLP